MSKKHGRENDTVEVVAETKKSDIALREEAILAFWNERDIFKKTLETPAGVAPVGDFIFYDGPPFATGLPHYGHILAGTIKDAIPRFWTMNGYRVRRQWGWDCHGLPLENQIEKELGLATKKDIEEYGIKNFNEKARSTVLRYADDWRVVVPRMGRFVDMETDYKTMDSSYTESVWWAFKSLHDKGLVFEGFKSMHLCPRCGTTLSNFEVNQGYKDIKDIAVTVKLPLLDDSGNVSDTSLLIWTTTPWTLPGNMAAAVHNEIDYVKVRVKTESGDELVILAKGRLEQLGDATYDVIETIKGDLLVGKKYQPPFPWIQEQTFEGKDKAWTIYHADYVELGEEGTGAVHIAPAYGEEDMVLAQKHGVPIIHHVNDLGHFIEFKYDDGTVKNTGLVGRLVKPKDDDHAGVSHLDTDIEIVKILKAHGILFKKENITHSYPHCWRCDTPLLNYATTSWFVNVPKIKDQLIAENNKVKWVPEHVGKNRFGDWLEGARDWAISRQRYWGAPLPIWKNPDTGAYKVFGSLAELQPYVRKSGNQYFVMRHGESVSNVEGFLNGELGVENPMTEKGRKQVAAAIAKLPRDIDLILHSPLQRTRETAMQLAFELGLSSEQVIEDERIRESEMGELEGKPNSEKEKCYTSIEAEYTEHHAGMENLLDIRRRMGAFLYEIDARYEGKKILIVSHGDPLCMLEAAAKGVSKEETFKIFDTYYENAVVRELPFVPMPRNDDFELDYHRPYIDEVELYEEGIKLHRVPDVFDCWFESGSMPFAQHHYPFESADTFLTKHYPANFIAEGLDQTRGWFYSLIVLGTALFGKSPYERVVVNGLALAEDGKKMSKSLRNYPDPMELADRTGADAMRFYLLSSSIIKGEDLNFSEKEVQELQRKNLGRLHNVLAMYEMYEDGTKSDASSPHVLDRWVVARAAELVRDVTAGFTSYELDRATRPVTDFIDDLSVWYLRRSRERLKGDDAEDKKRALATLRYTLRTLALVIAPSMPFYAEYLWQKVKSDIEAESVHIAEWPKIMLPDDVETLITDMSKVRSVVTEALEARTKLGIKVRQPITSVTGTEMSDDLRKIVLEELNAKEYIVGTEVTIDAVLTPELLAEGAVRELMRFIQETRKRMNLQPTDSVEVTINTDAAGKETVKAHMDLLKKTVGASSVHFDDTSGEVVTTDTHQFAVTVTPH